MANRRSELEGRARDLETQARVLQRVVDELGQGSATGLVRSLEQLQRQNDALQQDARVYRAQEERLRREYEDQGQALRAAQSKERQSAEQVGKLKAQLAALEQRQHELEQELAARDAPRQTPAESVDEATPGAETGHGAAWIWSIAGLLLVLVLVAAVYAARRRADLARRHSPATDPRHAGPRTMSCVLTLLTIVFVLVVAMAVARQPSAHVRQLQLVYPLVARRFGGSCQSAGRCRAPLVRFAYRDTVVALRTHRAPDFRRWLVTEVRLAWPEFPVRCELFYPPGAAPLSAPRGLREMPAGVGQFDSRYRLYAGAVEDVDRAFPPAVRAPLEKLRLSGGEPVHVACGRSGLCVQKARALTRFEDLVQFVELALELYDQIQLTRSQGIAFMDDTQAVPLEHVMCRVCGESIADDLVFCRRCKTPHHRDCWLYAGQCSVYACGETQFETPQIAAPPPRLRPAAREPCADGVGIVFTLGSATATHVPENDSRPLAGVCNGGEPGIARTS